MAGSRARNGPSRQLTKPPGEVTSTGCESQAKDSARPVIDARASGELNWLCAITMETATIAPSPSPHEATASR